MTTSPEAQPATNGAGTVENAAAAAPVGTSSQTVPSPGSDYKSLLQEYEQKTNPTTADIGKFFKAIEPVVGYVQEEARVRAETAERNEVDELVRLARGDNIPEEHSTLVRAVLRDLVATDPVAYEAWNNRSKNPEGLKTLHTRANAEVGKLIPQGQPTNDVRTDLDRAAAAVRNVSTDPPKLEHPDPITAMNMSDRDWEAHKARVRAANR